MKLLILTHGLIQVANNKVYCKTMNGTLKDLTQDTIYKHPSSKQCNYSVKVPTVTTHVNSSIGNDIGDKLQRLSDGPHNYIGKHVLKYRSSYNEIPAVIITQPYDVFVNRCVVKYNGDGSTSMTQTELAHLKGCDVTVSAGLFGPDATEVEICVGFDYSGSLSPKQNDNDTEYNQLSMWGSYIYIIGYED